VDNVPILYQREGAIAIGNREFSENVEMHKKGIRKGMKEGDPFLTEPSMANLWIKCGITGDKRLKGSA